LSGERVERRLTAILAADVAGYSRLMGQDEAGTLARLRLIPLPDEPGITERRTGKPESPTRCIPLLFSDCDVPNRQRCPG
jgi:hypothetical protein